MTNLTNGQKLLTIFEAGYVFHITEDRHGFASSIVRDGDIVQRFVGPTLHNVYHDAIESAYELATSRLENHDTRRQCWQPAPAYTGPTLSDM